MRDAELAPQLPESDPEEEEVMPSTSVEPLEQEDLAESFAAEVRMHLHAFISYTERRLHRRVMKEWLCSSIPLDT